MFKLSMLGNVTADPVLAEREYVDKATGEIIKTKVCNFTVAADNGYGDKKKTEFFRIHAWRGLAETCAKSLTKGRAVFVEGPVTINNYVGTDNQLHSSMEVRADMIQFIGSKPVVTPDPDAEEPAEDLPY